MTLMQKKLPQYIQNIFLACGYDTLQVIAEMDVNQSSQCNDIDKMLEYIKKTFPYDERYALSLTLLYGPAQIHEMNFVKRH